MTGRGRTLIVGIGSDFGDDRLGLIVAQQLAERLPWCTSLGLRSPADLLDRLDGITRLHVVDACHGGQSPGTIIRYDWPIDNAVEIRFSGTHDLDLVTVLKLADQLALLPQRVTLWGVEVPGNDNLQPPACDEPMTPTVESAIPTLIAQIVADHDIEALCFQARIASHA